MLSTHNKKGWDKDLHGKIIKDYSNKSRKFKEIGNDFWNDSNMLKIDTILVIGALMLNFLPSIISLLTFILL